MRASDKEEKAMIECYRRLFKESTPSGDFDKLVANAKLNKEGRKVIPFMDYEIEENVMSNIIDDVADEFKIKENRRDAFRISIYLGCSPKTKHL